MNKHCIRAAAWLLIGILCFSGISFAIPATAGAAAEPSLNYSKKTIIIGTTYTLQVQNVTDSKASYSWSTSDSSVATVNGKGKVTPKKEGTANITCRITYLDRSTKSLTCVVTAKERVEAENVAINNAKTEDLNAHVMTVGESYDFNRTLTPSDSTDSTYWVIDEEEYAEVSSQGVVTAKKAGITRLQARTGINKTEALKSENTVTDSIYLFIMPQNAAVTPTPVSPTLTPTPTPTLTPTPTPVPGAGQAVVRSVGLTGSRELSVAFGVPVDKSSVIGLDGYLTNAVSVIPGNSASNPPGMLTPALSEDGRTLTIRSAAAFEGTYIVLITGIRTTSGGLVASYSAELELRDRTGPTVIGNTTLDAAGYRNTIQFNEELDLSEMTVLGVDTYVSDSTKALLTEPYIYSLSEDKTAIIVDLSNIIIPSDLNKEITVTLNYIKDIAGNYTTPTFIKVKLYTDTTAKPASVPLSAERTSASTVTVTFDREVQYEGYIVIGGEAFYGTKDTQDPRRVVYNIGTSYYAQALTGIQTVTVRNWYSYHSSESSLNLSKDLTVDFTVSAKPPLLQSQLLYQTTQDNASVLRLVLSYDKNVQVSVQSGTLNVTLYDSFGNILQRTVSYSAQTRDQTVTLEVDQQMAAAGTYRVELPAGFVFDSYMNFSPAAVFTVTRQSGSGGDTLPEPTVTQDAANPSILYVDFAAKLDHASAQNVSNYLLANAISPTSAELISQSDSGARVRLTFASGAIEYDTNYIITVSGVKGYDGSYAALNQYTVSVYLRENKAPVFLGARITGSNMIELMFQENGMLMGAPFFSVTENGRVIGSSAWCSGSSVYISLYEPVEGGLATISPGYGNQITDMNGNVAVLPNTFIAVRAY